MEHSRQSSFPQPFENRVDLRKPQLPNFDHFVRSSGHPDLAYRGPIRLDEAFTSPTSGQTSLPTPPSASGQHVGWLRSEHRHEYEQDRQSAVVDDLDTSPHEYHRRASFAQPEKTRLQPRLQRSYSSVLEGSHREVSPWRHGRVLHEQQIPGKGLCYVYDDGTICPKEVNGDVVNPKWGTTKAGMVH